MTPWACTTESHPTACGTTVSLVVLHFSMPQTIQNGVLNDCRWSNWRQFRGRSNVWLWKEFIRYADQFPPPPAILFASLCWFCQCSLVSESLESTHEYGNMDYFDLDNIAGHNDSGVSTMSATTAALYESEGKCELFLFFWTDIEKDGYCILLQHEITCKS